MWFNLISVHKGILNYCLVLNVVLLVHNMSCLELDCTLFTNCIVIKYYGMKFNYKG